MNRKINSKSKSGNRVRLRFDVGYSHRKRRLKLFDILWFRRGKREHEWHSKLSVSLRPKLYSVYRDDYETRVTVLGVQVTRESGEIPQQ